MSGIMDKDPQQYGDTRIAMSGRIIQLREFNICSKDMQ